VVFEGVVNGTNGNIGKLESIKPAKNALLVN